MQNLTNCRKRPLAQQSAGQNGESLTLSSDFSMVEDKERNRFTSGVHVVRSGGMFAVVSDTRQAESEAIAPGRLIVSGDKKSRVKKTNYREENIMKKEHHDLARHILLAIMFGLLILATIGSSARAQGTDTLWIEKWEDPSWITNWHVDNGVWEVGVPTSGPGSSHEGTKCAATVLAGNYPMTADTRLIRHRKFVVPPASEHPRLRYWHWFSLSNADYGEVQLRVGTGSWRTISETYSSTSAAWSYASIDLSEWSDSTVEIAFYLHAQEDGNWTTDDVSSGWYVDEVAVITGSYVFDGQEDFASGIGDWSVDGGVWEVGMPQAGIGPGSAHSDSICAGTVLGGNYPMWQDTRLKSAPFVVPPASQHPRLRYWHWYSLSNADYAYLQLRVNGGPWQTVQGSFWGYSGAWSYASADLSEWADSAVEIAFYLHAQEDGNWTTDDVSSGWYVDDVSLVTGNPVFNNPEDFEAGIGDWSVDGGVWEVGTPAVSVGPGQRIRVAPVLARCWMAITRCGRTHDSKVQPLWFHRHLNIRVCAIGIGLA